MHDARYLNLELRASSLEPRASKLGGEKFEPYRPAPVEPLFISTNFIPLGRHDHVSPGLWC